MKKKFIGLTLIFWLLVGSTMSVSAAQLQMDGETANVPVTYDNQSTFCVNIPESIDLSNSDGYTFTADFMYLTETQKVCIYAPTGGVTMTNEFGVTGKATLFTNDAGSDCVATFLRQQTSASSPMYTMFDGMDAGHYEGIATFTIRLEPYNN